MNRFFIIAFLLLPASIFAQSYTTPIRVNLDKSKRADRAPIMKLGSGGNIYISWVSGADMSGNGPLSIAISTDGGATFSNQLVSSDANCNSNFQRGGEFIVDTKGHIHMVWVSARLGSTSPDVWYTRSVDIGKSWTTPVSLDGADDSSKYAQDFCSIACDSSDNLYVSFLDARNNQRGLSNVNFLYFTKSTDGGMNWTNPKRADMPPGGVGGTCECCSEHIAATADGHIYIAYRSNINNLRDIWLERSYDKGETFQPALKIMSGDWNIDACPVTGPNITLDDSEAAHIVWRDARDGSDGAHLYYVLVPKGSMATPVNTLFDAKGSTLPNYPSVSLYGKFRAIMYETSSNFGMRYILSSDTTSLVKNRPIQANAQSSKYFANILFASDGTRYLSWQDNMTDEGDIYFMKETSALPVAPSAITLISPAANTTNLSVPVTLSWQKNDLASSYHVIVIMDDSLNYPRIIDSAGITSTSLIISKLPYNPKGGRFTWRVAGASEVGEGVWSEARDFTVSQPSSVKFDEKNSFSIYPNPVSKENPFLHIERISNLPATLRIVDLLGREITSFPLTSELSQTISFPKITPGIYYCILSDGSAPKKIIIGE